MPAAKKTRVKQLDDAALGTAHTLSGDDIAAHWVVQPAMGLSAEEALQRQSQFGLNQLPAAPPVFLPPSLKVF